MPSTIVARENRDAASRAFDQGRALGLLPALPRPTGAPETRQHVFDDLSLIDKDGFLALSVSGEAELEHDLDGVTVRDIWLDACRRATPEERAQGASYYVNGRILLSISEHQWLWCAIADRLEKTVETEVHGPSDRAEHSTLHRAFQGV